MAAPRPSARGQTAESDPVACESSSEADQSLIPSNFAQGSRAGCSAVLRLRGLPFASTESDIVSFFAGYQTNQVYICRRDGRSTGEAYVVLASPEDAQTALSSLNKQFIGNRYIELFEAAQADLTAVRKVLEDSRLQGFVVRLRGLPYSATAADIEHFFSGVQISQAEDAIVFAQAVDGRPTGEAYVELTDEQALSLAMTRHKQLMGSRYVEIFNSGKVDKLQALQQARCHAQSSQNRVAGWPRSPSAAAVSHVGQMPVATMSAGPFVSLQNADQLADCLAATHITQVASSATEAVPAVVAAGHYATAASIALVPDTFTGHPAAAAAHATGFVATGASGRQANEPSLSPEASPAAVPAARQYQMVASQGPVLVGPNGQPQQPVYYMHPAQGMMWSGQPGGPRPPIPLNMVSMVPISAAPLMASSSTGGGPTTVHAMGQAPTGAWSSDAYHHIMAQGYTQQQKAYQPTGASALPPALGSVQQPGPVPVPCVWTSGMPIQATPLSTPGMAYSSIAGNW